MIEVQGRAGHQFRWQLRRWINGFRRYLDSSDAEGVRAAVLIVVAVEVGGIVDTDFSDKGHLRIWTSAEVVVRDNQRPRVIPVDGKLTIQVAVGTGLDINGKR